MSTETRSGGADGVAGSASDTLTVTDNRTGQTYEVRSVGCVGLEMSQT